MDYEDGDAADDVAQRNGQDVFEHGIRLVQGRAVDQHADSYQVHVGHAMLEATRDEACYRQDDCEDFRDDVLGHDGHDYREDDKHVAENPADERLGERDSEFGVCYFHRQVAQAVQLARFVEQARLSHQHSEDHRAYEVADVDRKPISQHPSLGDHAGEHADEDRNIAREQLSPGDNNQHQANAKKSSAENLAKPSCDGNEKQLPAKTYIKPRQNTQEQKLPDFRIGFAYTQLGYSESNVLMTQTRMIRLRLVHRFSLEKVISYQLSVISCQLSQLSVFSCLCEIDARDYTGFRYKLQGFVINYMDYKLQGFVIK